MEVQQGKLSNQEESLKRSIAELFRPIISSIPNPADQEQLEKNCQSFTHQLINYLNQYQQPQQPQQPQINPSQKENTLKRRRTESLDAKTQLLVNHRARSEPNNNNNPARLNPTLNIQRSQSLNPSTVIIPSNFKTDIPDHPSTRSDTQPKPTKAIPSAAREATITETHDHHPTDQQPSELESTTLHPTSNLIQEDDQEDPISDDLRLFIQNEIECGFDDMAYQFDDSLKDAKRELIMLNREYLEDLLEKLKGNDSSTSQNHIPPIPPTSPPTKIEAGSIGEKLKFKFENHTIDCYQDYHKQFVFAIGYSGLGTEPFDFQVHHHHHHQPDQPAASEAQLDHKTPVIDPKDEESVVIKTKIESPSKEDLERNSLAIERLVEEKLRSKNEEIGRMVDEKVKSYNEEIGRMVEEKVGLDDEKKLLSINQKIEEQLKEKIGEISAKTEQVVQGMLMSNSQKVERHIEEKLRPISAKTEQVVQGMLMSNSQKVERHIEEKLRPISEQTERIIDEKLTLTSQKIERQIQEELRPISKETEKMMDEKLISTSRKIERQIEEKLRPINEETEKIVQEKLNSYHKGLEKHAVEYRKGIRSEIVQCKEEMSKDLDSLIDQIEGLFLGEKDKLVNLHKQTDGLQQRIKRLEGVIEKETDPVLRRTSVLVSLGLIDSDHINQKLNLNIFLTKLNAHLKVNLGQIDIRDPERNPRIPLLQPHDHHEPESRPGTSNDPNQANTDINNSNTPGVLLQLFLLIQRTCFLRN
ncbi:hypothetical protein, variant [Puccinia graminis f. sp. tritici CRL 75-36-700-3]|uniref:Uncharacterized protein n=1 Tax=Puccinia graminis f. sp. tritici (strain CRL 75-36-700-3 / race SCCL) TaxID=418459 RepID=H6QPT9_PUCGT|nr:hypothetical protein, variant [Puccinia graminis f. sp. tritici CRL 75-36-700-3]EHS64326.1 hypothetical protein, variant [Puccinia graminis f. sp. tritici CRL 75-36-700-3]